MCYLRVLGLMHKRREITGRARRERAFFSRRAEGAGLFHVFIVGIDHVAVKAGVVVRAATLGLRIVLRLLIELF